MRSRSRELDWRAWRRRGSARAAGLRMWGGGHGGGGGCILILGTLLTHCLTFRQVAPFLTLDEFPNSLSDSTEDTWNMGENPHL